ncbi:DDE transposase [Acetobacter orientalis]|uniref:DDE transposase n=1 Tax=Acetobacter orientalis TaxID=146474 RepID=A0A2Z5ZMA6_9PROT|nr:DDE transposase [Acetobacter orientalis]
MASAVIRLMRWNRKNTAQETMLFVYGSVQESGHCVVQFLQR